MTITQQFFTLAEAVEELGMPEHAVLRKIRDGDLPICFDADETLIGVTIQRPDGTIEHVALPVPLDGVLACHGDRADAGGIEAVGVRVVNIRGITFSRNPDGALTKGHKLPTIGESNGYIKPGYRVTGFVDFVHVEMADWLFHRDDLQAVKDGIPAESAQKEDSPATSADDASPGSFSAESTADDEIAALFDPVKVEQLEAMFPASNKWKSYAYYAYRNGLKGAARTGKGVFNPYRAALWWLTTGPDGWKLERCLRTLAKNLPARSADSRSVLTGEIE